MKRCIIFILLVSMLLMVGCLDSQAQKGSSKKAVKQVLQQLVTAYEKEDVETILSLYSEDFEGGDGNGKEQLVELLNGMKDQGYLTDTELNIEDVKLKVEGDTVTAAPLTYSGGWGQVDYTTTFKKEGSGWKAIGGAEYYGE